MEVLVTETFKVKVDSYKNHQPMYFKKGGDIISTGKNVGQISEDKWVTVDKYFRTLSEAILYGLEHGLIESGDKLVSEDDITAETYLSRLERNANELKQLMGAVKKEGAGDGESKGKKEE